MTNCINNRTRGSPHAARHSPALFFFCDHNEPHLQCPRHEDDPSASCACVRTVVCTVCASATRTSTRTACAPPSSGSCHTTRRAPSARSRTTTSSSCMGRKCSPVIGRSWAHTSSSCSCPRATPCYSSRHALATPGGRSSCCGRSPPPRSASTTGRCAPPPGALCAAAGGCEGCASRAPAERVRRRAPCAVPQAHGAQNSNTEKVFNPKGATIFHVLCFSFHRDHRNKEKMHTDWKIQQMRIVRHTSCIHSSPIFWILLGGHLRTFSLNADNIHAMATRSSSCPFVCVSTRKFEAEGSLGFGHKIVHPIVGNVTHTLETKGTKFANFAYAISDSSSNIPRIWAHLDTWFSGMEFIREIISTLKIAVKKRDMVLFSRPDVIFSHPIQLESIYDEPRAFYLSHSARNIGRGNDPTELFVLMNLAIWEEYTKRCNTTIIANKRTISVCPAMRNCVGIGWDPVAEGPEYLGAALAYASPSFSIGIVRAQHIICLHGTGCKQRIVDKPLNFSKGSTPFHSRCHPQNGFDHRKAMIHHYVAPSPVS